MRIGVLGSGGIATADYGVLPNLHHYAEISVAAIADVVAEQARAVAARFNIPAVYGSLEEMIAAGEIDAVVNLTPIPFHFATSRLILESGLHLVTEKPIASTMAEADELISIADRAGLTIVCAPPDMLFEPYERAAEIVRSGQLGRIAFARVHSSHAGPGGGPRGWASDPSWFYRDGSGPLLDMGVYGIHEITGILGPAKRVVAFSGVTDPVRVVRGGPFAGLEMPVEADDNSLFMLDFGDSTFAVIDGSYNLLASKSPKVEIFGRRGVLNILRPGAPDLEVYKTDLLPGTDGWIEPSEPLAVSARRARFGRAIMVGHLADCVLNGTKPVMSAEHARHALEVMLGVATSARENRIVDLTTTF
ncbi:oxidoreductase [Leifsonia sp. Root227]|nr:oxidoreductase [Leifsonia sp. Root227]